MYVHIHNNLGFIINRKPNTDILLEKVKFMKSLNFSEEYIDACLLSHGYSVKQINEAFKKSEL